MHSFDALFEKYNKKVYAFSLSNLKNREDAEGVVQEVFLSLWKDRANLKKVKKLDAWIFSVAFNVIRKRFRKLAREKRHLDALADISLPHDNSTISEVEYNDLLEKADRIIEKLPPRQKRVFVMSRSEGLSNEEISKKLSITKKSVENHLTTAKSFLKEAFLDERLLTLLFFWLYIR